MPRSRPVFFTVAAATRSETRWYAARFTTRRSFCFHELTSILDRYPTNLATIDAFERGLGDHDLSQLGRRLVLDAFPDYFSRLSEVAERGLAAGNSDAGATAILTGLGLLWPEMRFLFSFGDGIRGVDALARERLDPVVRALDQSHSDGADAFAQCCERWTASVTTLEAHRDRLRAHGAAVLETRFERLVGDADELEEVVSWLLRDREAAAEASLGASAPIRDAPPGVERPRSAEEIWAGWNAEQRALFAAVCGEPQRRLGYAFSTVSGDAEARVS